MDDYLWAFDALQLLSAFFIILLGVVSFVFLLLFLIDIFQTKHTIRRNYPLLGRFRYLFEHLGTFFRQYFFSHDQEEMPFNRAERAWVYRAAKNVDSTIAFGSTKDTRAKYTVIFLNAPFPILERDADCNYAMIIGPHCRAPYQSSTFFNISGMSYGAISIPAIKALSLGAHRAGCWLNTGEGGLSPYHIESGADIVFQIGTAKYGVRDQQGLFSIERLKEIAENPYVKMFEIKLSQGAKPGKGGILPGTKVTAEIAAIRRIVVGQDSISPNRHEELQSNEDLLRMIDQVRSSTGKPVGIKFVLGSSEWLTDLFQLIGQQGIECAPDFITLDSADGGTGAAPMSLIDDVGLTLRDSLPFVVKALNEYGLKNRIRLIASGKLITPSKIAWALATGADFVSSARGFMFALGCIQALQCNRNTCPTGITTHNKSLQRGLVPEDKAERVYYYHQNIIKEVEMIAHACGVPQARLLNRTHYKVVL